VQHLTCAEAGAAVAEEFSGATGDKHCAAALARVAGGAGEMEIEGKSENGKALHFSAWAKKF